MSILSILRRVDQPEVANDDTTILMDANQLAASVRSKRQYLENLHFEKDQVLAAMAAETERTTILYNKRIQEAHDSHEEARAHALQAYRVLCGDAPDEDDEE